MLKDKMLDAINDQINAELFSSYLYYSMAAHFGAIGLPGISNWMRMQALEELIHADKFFAYINERGGQVLLKPIEGPQTSWKTPMEAFEATLEHEQYITSRINNLMDIAIEIRDHATANFLQWFISEQVEEESSVEEILGRLRLIGDNTNGLFWLDQELGRRLMPVAPTSAE